MTVVGCRTANKGGTENNILGIKEVNFNYLVVSEMIITLMKTRTFTFPTMSKRLAT